MDPVVEEATSTLKEWNHLRKQLFVEGDQQKWVLVVVVSKWVNGSDPAEIEMKFNRTEQKLLSQIFQLKSFKKKLPKWNWSPLRFKASSPGVKMRMDYFKKNGWIRWPPSLFKKSCHRHQTRLEPTIEEKDTTIIWTVLASWTQD